MGNNTPWTFHIFKNVTSFPYLKKIDFNVCLFFYRNSITSISYLSEVFHFYHNIGTSFSDFAMNLKKSLYVLRRLHFARKTTRTSDFEEFLKNGSRRYSPTDRRLYLLSYENEAYQHKVCACIKFVLRKDIILM